MINVAIIGTGGISDVHIKAYLKFPKRCKIVALVNQNIEKAQLKAATYQFYAIMNNLAHDKSEGEDISLAILKFNNGSLAQISSSIIHHGQNQQLVFQGEKAEISSTLLVKASLQNESGFQVPNLQLEQVIKDTITKIPKIEDEPFNCQIENMIFAIENDDLPSVQGIDGRASVELITAIYKAASTGKKVILPIKLDDDFYTLKGIGENVQKFNI